jgi:hypothetical protein
MHLNFGLEVAVEKQPPAETKILPGYYSSMCALSHIVLSNAGRRVPE